MALVLLESWDGYGGDGTQAARNWSGAPAFTTVAKTGTYALGGSNTTMSRALTPSTGTVFFGAWVYWTSGTQPVQNGALVCFTSSYPFSGFNAVCGLSINTDGSLRVTRSFNPGTTLGTSAACLVSGAWNYIEAKFVFGGSGSYIVKCNGTEVLNASGNMGGTTIGAIHTASAPLVSFVDVYAMDSLWILDSSGSAPYNTFLGEQLVTGFAPSTGNGALTGLTPSTGSDHGALVDEAVANDDTDYNAGGAGLTDTYVFDTSALAGFTINGVQLTCCAKADTAGTNTIAGVARVGGTAYNGTTQAITTSYDYYMQVWGPRPSDSAPWTQSDLAQFGMKSVASAGANRLTKIYLEVLSSSSGGSVDVSGPLDRILRGVVRGVGRGAR